MLATAPLAMAIAAAEPANAVAVAPLVQPPQADARALLLTPAEMFALAERAVARGDERIAGSIYRALEQDPDSTVRAEARFRNAMLLLRSNRSRDAALLFRRVLDEKPDAAAARLQLARALHRLGDEDGALRQLRLLSTLDLPPTVARFVDRLSASLQAKKPLGFQLEFALAPDSNINRATRSDTLGTVLGDFTVDEEGKARSGIGASVRGLAQARLPLTDGLDVVARSSANANLYRHKEFNDISIELSAGPELRLGRTRLTAEGGLFQQWYGMKPYQRGLRLAAGIARPVDSASQIRLDGATRWTDNRLNDLQDGRGVSGRLRYERALSPRLLVAASVGGDRYKAKDDAYSTRSWSAGLSAYRDMGRMTLIAGAEVGRLKADERLALLPEARRDRLTRLHLGAVFRQFSIGGLAPIARIVVERNRSSVEFHDYRRTRTEFGFSRAF